MARVVVLTPNPAVDVTYEVARQELGGTVRVRRASRRPGGKGVNVATVLRTLGHDALALLPLGGDSGRWLHAALREEGVATAVVPLDDRDEHDERGDPAGPDGAPRRETRSTVTVVDGLSPPTVYSEPGPAVPAATWDRVVAETFRRCEQDGWLVVAGSFPPGSEHVVGSLVRAAHQAGSRVLVDTSGDALLLAADAGADLLKPNAEEALEATGATTLAEAAQRLRPSTATRVVFSCGSEGLIGHDGDTVDRQPAVPDVVGNPTGAGDAATAGLVAALTRGADLASAMRWAAVLGAAAVLSPLAGQIRLGDLAPLASRLAPGPDDDLLPTGTTPTARPDRTET